MMARENCLHCKIMELIADHFDEVAAGGTTVIDAMQTLRALAEVAGYTIASAPEDGDVLMLRQRFADNVQWQVTKLRQRGEQHRAVTVIRGSEQQGPLQ